MCRHLPPCPHSAARNCCTAHVVADHSEQGWVRLCNGLILFDDHVYLAPDGYSRPIPASAA